MIPGRITGTTRVLGKSQGYLGLPVRDITYEDGSSAMQTAWIPSPKELEALNAGAPVLVTILGSAHPPINLETGEKPECA